MLRSSAQRAHRLRAWERLHPGQEPPVEIRPPGLRARRFATVAQKKAVQQVLRQHQDELARLERSHVNAVLPLLRRAQEELQRDLRQWIARTPDGELRFTAHKYRSAVVQLRGMVLTLEDRFRDQLTRSGRDAQEHALRHLVDEVGRFSGIFGDHVQPLQLNLAHLVTTGQASLVPRYRASAERYVWSKNQIAPGVWLDLNQRLAIEILKGSSVHAVIERLVEHGGPRGLVALQGVAGEENAVVELIPEGLFKRYRSRAETYVRTEMAAAYGLQARRGLAAAAEILPDLQRRWCADGGGCPLICQPMDGQVVGLNENFIDGTGVEVQDQPAHPRCRCRVGAWRAHWPALFDSLGID